MAEITRGSSREAAEFQGESGEGFVSSSEFYRRSLVHVPSDVQEATSQWKLGMPAQEISNSSTAGSEISGKRKRKSDSSEDEAALKPYECRFCPMKFAKSQALGGHMNRHRQEREREQLLHARQLVLQQGLSWVAGQNTKLQRSPDSPMHYNPRVGAPMTPSFQLSSSLQSSLSWNISSMGGGGLNHHVIHDGGAGPISKSSGAAVAASAAGGGGGCADESSIPLMLRGYCSQGEPYMAVQHAATVRASFGSGDIYDKASLLDCNSVQLPHDFHSQLECEAAAEKHAAAMESSSSQAPDQLPSLQLAAPDSSSDFPPLQLGPCSSEIPSLNLSSEVSPLQMAVDCDCPHQLLSLGGYQAAAAAAAAAGLNAFSADGYRGSNASPLADLVAGQAAPWDGLSWIFNSGTQKAAPVSSPDGFSLALGYNNGGGGGGGGGGEASIDEEKVADDDAHGCKAAEREGGGDLSLLNFSGGGDDCSTRLRETGIETSILINYEEEYPSGGGAAEEVDDGRGNASPSLGTH